MRAVICVLLLAACDVTREPAAPRSSPVTQEPAPFASALSLTPVKTRMNTGELLRVEVVAFDAQRRVLPRAAIAWSSSDATIAHVDAGGVVRALTPGYVTITARSGAASAFALLQVGVNGDYPTSVIVEPPVTVVSACTPLQLYARTDPDVGDTRFRWSSSDEQILHIEQAGTARGIAPGAATLSVAWAPDSSRRTSRAVTVTSCSR